MMSSVHNSVETVNAAASAIVTAETRVQPSTFQKRRWKSCLSLRYWCFGNSSKQYSSKRIGHAVLVSSELTPPGPVSPITNNHSNNNNSSSTIAMMPFIVPPSSPASFLPSESPSGTHSPAGFLSLAPASLSVHERAQIYTIGPYAHETQLVSPPLFSAFTTEPSTASYTPQMTTPSSPEVPFAQLLSSSLERKQRYGGSNLGYSLSKYELQPMSNSGTSSPFVDKFHGYEHFLNYKWGSRVGSGSLTPTDGEVSSLGSGTLTPTNYGGDFSSRDGKQNSEVASLANSGGDYQS